MRTSNICNKDGTYVYRHMGYNVRMTMGYVYAYAFHEDTGLRSWRCSYLCSLLGAFLFVLRLCANTFAFAYASARDCRAFSLAASAPTQNSRLLANRDASAAGTEVQRLEGKLDSLISNTLLQTAGMGAQMGGAVTAAKLENK